MTSLTIPRMFTLVGEDPFDTVTWESRSALIRDAQGHIIFEQQDIEAPTSWSDMALNVVASRYFRGFLHTSERERSVRRLIQRVVDTITAWGMEQRYFASQEDAQTFRDELVHLILHQKASFNSPVWFNVGVEAKPQCSACFIVSVEDTMESILQWYTQEGLIFKGGSGSGANLSRLRSSREPLSGGGTASGPVSFMKASDALAGVIKSGGKTRRAAKIVILNADHPDILEFIRCKAREERKAQALVRAGYIPSMDGELYASIAFQNSNHSVRLTDDFMEADAQDALWHTRFVLSGEIADTYRARDIMREIAVAAHACGDPGVQFDSTINRWHTCPASGPITASNPCSEYLHVENSACNLASLRLTAFLGEDGVFDVQGFRFAIDLMITAQDILVDRASYPTEAITKNSKNLRALGLGYADLGALLMSLGIAYDSDQARAWASALTAILTGEAYLQSARLAEALGSFPEFVRNREAMLRVMDKHRAALASIPRGLIPDTLWETSAEVWDQVVEWGKRCGFRNCQTTVLAPTGTVAFMMDCDTTGIEPELALVKYKTLAGGGHLKLVNRAVAHGLRRLGYEERTVSEMLDEIQKTGSLEQCKTLHPEHRAVFDCAFRPLGGTRSISPDGHLLMMAAVQPFLSGAISKTVNLPSETTPEAIEEIFRRAWKLGLKAISVYRDGCKAHQPLSLHPASSRESAAPVRKRLPTDCRSIRHKFEIAGQKGYIHTGFYEDGQVGEIFIRMAKEGSTISGLMDTIATLTSIALQYGVPLEALVNKFSHVRFEPSGFTSNPDIPLAKSLTDYIFRYLGTRFLTKEQQEAAGLLPRNDLETPTGSLGTSVPQPLPTVPSQPGHAFHPQSDAPACQDCGAITVRYGSCYHCINCGATYGCS